MIEDGYMNRHSVRRDRKNTLARIATVVVSRAKSNDGVIRYNYKLSEHPDKMTDRQLLDRCCRGVMCEVCTLRCGIGDELMKRGIDSKEKHNL